jgi:hypothetical protein
MLKGFWIVDETRFRALPEATLKEWFASGELGLVYAHLCSLGNLLELLRRQPAAQANAASEASAGDAASTRAESSVGAAPSVVAAASAATEVSPMTSTKRRRGGRNAAA